MGLPPKKPAPKFALRGGKRSGTEKAEERTGLPLFSPEEIHGLFRDLGLEGLIAVVVEGAALGIIGDAAIILGADAVHQFGN
jgi:hypothetical protein